MRGEFDDEEPIVARLEAAVQSAEHACVIAAKPMRAAAMAEFNEAEVRSVVDSARVRS